MTSHFIDVNNECAEVARDASFDRLVLKHNQAFILGRAGPLNSNGLQIEEDFQITEPRKDL